jgi:hypothetical protein
LLRLLRTLFGGSSSKDAEAQSTRENQRSGMFVRLANGRRIEIAGAEYVIAEEGGRVLFLDRDREVLREFPWGDVVAHGRMK